MRVKYVVIECFPGCMPENEPAEFTNRRDAESYAYQTARDYVADRDGAKLVGSRGSYRIDYPMGGMFRVYVSEV